LAGGCSDGGAFGGGIYANAALTVRDSLVEGNELVSDDEGGALWGGGIAKVGAGPFLIEGSTIRGNRGRSAAGLWSQTEATMIVDTVIEENEAEELAGGAIFQGPVRVERSSIRGNLSGLDVGGAYIAVERSQGFPDPSPFEFVDATVSGNNAVRAGGGLAFVVANGAQARLSFANSTLSGNEAAEGGRDLHVEGVGDDALTHEPSLSFAALTNATLSGSGEPRERAIFVGGRLGGTGLVEAVNTVVDGACTASAGGGIASLGHNVARGVSCGFTGAGDRQGVDPKLGPLAANGGPTLTHALLAGSPAIDGGDPAFCPVADQRGEARADGRCDVGAYEYKKPTLCGGAQGPVAASGPLLACAAVLVLIAARRRR
ncbi:MAG: hypothetical protein K8I02_03080, partial [Candidatus Methylomirabilis sp.]|nr:hypothetical protein [Deltaproteobacteria bacterium]